MRVIPHILTLGNLSLGAAAVWFVLYKVDPTTAVTLILIASLLDFLDGFVARLLGVAGELGKQLDSLADMVSFGVFPATLAFLLLPEGSQDTGFALILLLIPAMSALRLALFNIKTGQSEGFIGVPTPMNTLFWVGAWFAFNQYPSVAAFFDSAHVLYYSMVVMSALLMVVNFPMPSLKIKERNAPTITRLLLFLVPSAWFVVSMGIAGFFLVYFHYLLCAVLFKFALK